MSDIDVDSEEYEPLGPRSDTGTGELPGLELDQMVKDAGGNILAEDSDQGEAKEADAEQTNAEQTDAEQTNAEQTDAEQTDAEQTDNEEFNVDECLLSLDDTLKQLTSQYTAAYNKKKPEKKWNNAFTICLKTYYKECVDFIINKGEAIFRTIRSHLNIVNTFPENDVFERSFMVTLNSLKALRDDQNIDKYAKFLGKLKGVQWAYYRTPPMPRLKFIIKEFERVKVFLNTSLQKIDDYSQKTKRYKIASTRLLNKNFVSKYEIFTKDTRERFLYRSSRNQVVKFSCLLNNLPCMHLKKNLKECKNYGIMGTRYCYQHLLERNLKAKPSYTTPGQMAFFAWLPSRQRTEFFLKRPVFSGPSDDVEPRLETFYGQSNAPELSVFTDAVLQSGNGIILEHVLSNEAPTAEELISESVEEINENPGILPFNCGTPLNYLHKIGSVSVYDDDTGLLSRSVVQRSDHRRFAFVTVKIVGTGIQIFPLEDIFHGQELVLLSNNLYKPSSQDSYGQIVHNGVKRGQSSQPLTPAQIHARISLDQNVNENPDKIYDMSELKHSILNKRTFEDLF